MEMKKISKRVYYYGRGKLKVEVSDNTLFWDKI